jgi:predicted permease
VLVVSEVALACVLLIGAGLLLRSFINVLDVDLGFRPEQASVIKVAYDDGGDGIRRSAILREMLRRVEAIPGIEAAGIGDMLPLGRNRSWGLRAKGKTYPRDTPLVAVVRVVTPGYLRAMGIHLRAGRDFSWADRDAFVIINEAAARRFWAGEDPLGRMGQINGADVRVIGVAEDVRELSVEAAAGPAMYVSVANATPEGSELVIRSKLPPEALASSVWTTLRGLNPEQPAVEVRPLRRIVQQAVSPRRFFVLLAAGFAVLGLALAALGIYGVISYSVTARRQEIGTRMALGASAARVQREVIARALWLAALGISSGAAISLGSARWMASILYGTTPWDAATFAAVVILLCATSIIAGYVPARRASRSDPVAVLRGS